MKEPVFYYLRLAIVSVAVVFLTVSCQRPGKKTEWKRGNLHTHTAWSDGDDFPESVAKWYKDNSYDFLVFTDHNTLLETPVTGTAYRGHRIIDGELWQMVHLDHPSVMKYLDNFGSDWADIITEEGNLLVRLRALEDFRGKFEEPGKFLLMMGNEITDRLGVHLVAIHQDEVIPPVGGVPGERAAMIREILSKSDDYRQRSGRNTWPILAHPNFMWAITAEKILEVPDLRFFEVYNGHPAVNNEGDEYRAGTERIWDIVLSFRLASGNSRLLYGVATDDAHNYHSGGATPGRGWVMVRSAELSTEAILDAIDKGWFYSTTGVTLKDIRFDGQTISIEIEPEPGVTYTTEYIGTLKGFEPSNTPALDAEGNEIQNATRVYSNEIGRVLKSTNEMESSYTLSGEELYVRVKVTSSSAQIDQITGEEIGTQVAWVQPVLPGVAK